MSLRSGELIILDVSYDLEMKSLVKLESGVAVDSLDLVMSKPSKSNQSIDFKLYNDGDFLLEISNIIDTSENKIPHEPLPDNSPEISKIVSTSSKIDFYDKNNQLISSENISTPKLLDLVDAIDTIKSQYSVSIINQAIANMQSSSFDINLQNLLDSAAIYGYPTYDLPGDNIAIRMPVNAASTYYLGDSTLVTDQSILLIDEVRNLIMGSVLYDDQGNTKSATFYKYSSDGTPYLESIHQEFMKQMHSTERIRMIRDYKISNLSIITS